MNVHLQKKKQKFVANRQQRARAHRRSLSRSICFPQAHDVHLPQQHIWPPRVSTRFCIRLRAARRSDSTCVSKRRCRNNVIITSQVCAVVCVCEGLHGSTPSNPLLLSLRSCLLPPFLPHNKPPVIRGKGGKHLLIRDTQNGV